MLCEPQISDINTNASNKVQALKPWCSLRVGRITGLLFLRKPHTLLSEPSLNQAVHVNVIHQNRDVTIHIEQRNACPFPEPSTSARQLLGQSITTGTHLDRDVRYTRSHQLPEPTVSDTPRLLWPAGADRPVERTTRSRRAPSVDRRTRVSCHRLGTSSAPAGWTPAARAAPRVRTE